MSESLPTLDAQENMPAEPLATRVTRPFTIFFTGLPAAGKTTLSRAMKARLSELGLEVRLWDGDEVRRTVSADLGFSREDRIENIRRMAGLAAESEEDISIVAAVSPSDDARDVARDVIAAARDFVLIYLSTPRAVCEDRDPKGLYAKARSGEIDNFTGVSDPYEAPSDADLALDTSKHPIETCVDRVMEVLKERELIR